MHPAQASDNAPAGHDRARFHRPTTPLTRRGLPIGLGVNLDGTTAEPATEDRRGPHHGRCRPRQICFAPRAGWLSVHVRQHPREVSSLSRGILSQPLSGPLQAGLRFLPRPLPAAPSAHLTAGLPSREDDGLTTLPRRNPRGLGPAFTPVARHLRRMSLQHPDLATYRFGPSLSAPLGYDNDSRQNGPLSSRFLHIARPTGFAFSVETRPQRLTQRRATDSL